MWMPNFLRRRLCKHESCFLPVVPMMGSAPYKVCYACGSTLPFSAADGAIGQNLKPVVIGATMIDVSGNASTGR